MYWKIAIFLMMLIWMFWHKVEVNKKMNDADDKEEAFWEKERKANSVRKKSIEELDYIHLPKEEDLPLSLLSDKDEMVSILHTYNELKNDKILNLTGFTNTDLKLKYGAPNLTVLTRYDQNYTSLVTTFQKWADLLMEADYQDEAIKLMEYLVSIRADIGKTYRLLGKHYLRNGETGKYEELILKAELLKSLNKPHIVESLKELQKDDGLL